MQSGKNETYEEVEMLVYSIVHKFKKKYGGDFEELLSEANYLFLLVYDSYCESIGEFTTWLHFRIWKGLLDHLGKDIKLRKNIIYGDLDSTGDYGKDSQDINNDFNQIPQNKIQETCQQNHFMLNLKSYLSMESKDVIRLVLDMPNDLLIMSMKKGNSPRNVKSSLRQYLKERGWKKTEINDCFSEIKEALLKI